MIRFGVWRWLAALTLLVGGTSGVHAQGTPAPVTPANAEVRVGDVLKLWIWREEDLSGEFPVPESGVIVLPKIGPRRVTGMGAQQLKTELIAEYQKYLRNPAIEVTFLRRVNVLGAVRQPGVYPLDATMTVAMAVAMAGGVMPDGNANRVELLRNGKRLVANINQMTTIAELPIQSGDQLYVPQQSWAIRNISALVSGGLGLLSIAIAVFRN
jgi:protein involved in polysaccharide export with SLBB domain